MKGLMKKRPPTLHQIFYLIIESPTELRQIISPINILSVRTRNLIRETLIGTK